MDGGSGRCDWLNRWFPSSSSERGGACKKKCPSGGMKREVVTAAKAPVPIGPYSQAIRVGRTLYCSGVIGVDPKTGALVGPDVVAQTTRILDTIRAVLEAGGSSLANVLKVTILLTSMDDFARVNEIYGSYFPHSPPARTTFAVAGLPRNARIEIECIARVPS